MNSNDNKSETEVSDKSAQSLAELRILETSDNNWNSLVHHSGFDSDAAKSRRDILSAPNLLQQSSCSETHNDLVFSDNENDVVDASVKSRSPSSKAEMERIFNSTMVPTAD